jgi:hypothetical protein
MASSYPTEPLMDIPTYFGDLSMFAALIDTLFGIWVLLRKERNNLTL